MPENRESVSIKRNKVSKTLKLLTEYNERSDFEGMLPYARRLLLLIGGDGAVAGPVAPEPAADNADSVKLRLARDLTDALAHKAAGAHAATYFTGRINEPGIAMDDNGVLSAWDYDPTNPSVHIVVTEADLADDAPGPDPAEGN